MKVLYIIALFKDKKRNTNAKRIYIKLKVVKFQLRKFYREREEYKSMLINSMLKEKRYRL